MPFGEPLRARRTLALRAMPIATGVVGNAGGTAVIALLDMATEHSRPACRDRAHHAPFDTAEMLGTGSPKRFAMAAEDLRHFQNRSHQVRSAGWHDLQAEPIQRTWRIADSLGGDLGIARRAGQTGMAEQHLDDAHVGPVLQEMGRECVPQRMHCH
ncbi:hypothetical protein ACVWZK_008378 [Bradyrhizobium sp. GM0.4]